MVVLVTPGCHLCDAALDAVAEVCESIGVAWTSRLLGDLDPGTGTRWRDYIPVVAVDGAVHDVLRVDAPRLRRDLTGG